MKRWLIVFLLGVLLMSMSACVPVHPAGKMDFASYSDKSPTPTGIVGKWECNDMNQVVGLLSDFADGLSGLDLFGPLGDNVDVSVDLVFRQDGTYQLDMAVMMLIVGTQTETVTGTYSWQNDRIIIDGEVLDAKLSGNKLTISSKTPDGYVVRLEFDRVK